MSTTIQDYLLSRVNIHVTGPAFPHREEPLQCYIPLHRSYSRTSPPPPSWHRPLIPGSSVRTVPSAEAKDGQAFVYDKDIVHIWRLDKTMQAYEVFFWEKALEAAVGQEVLSVAMERWLEREFSAGECLVCRYDR